MTLDEMFVGPDGTRIAMRWDDEKLLRGRIRKALAAARASDPEDLLLYDIKALLQHWGADGETHRWSATTGSSWPPARRLGRFLRALDHLTGRGPHGDEVYEALKGWASDLVGPTAVRGAEIPGAYELLLERINDRLGRPARRGRRRA